METYKIVIYSLIFAVALIVFIFEMRMNSRRKERCKELEQQQLNKGNKPNQANNSEENKQNEKDSLYMEYVFIYIFVKLKERGYDSIEIDEFLQVFFDELQTFPEDSNIRAKFSEIKNTEDVGFEIMSISVTYEFTTGKKGFMRNKKIKLKNYFNFPQSELVKLNEILDKDAEILVEKVVNKLNK